jgi:hypothetical protein
VKFVYSINIGFTKEYYKYSDNYSIRQDWRNILEDSKDRNRLEQELIEVKHRIEILDVIENKLFQMKAIAEYVRDNDLSGEEMLGLNIKIDRLRDGIRVLEEEGREINNIYIYKL